MDSSTSSDTSDCRGGVLMADGWTDEWMLFVESTLPEGICIYPITSLEAA